MRNLWGARHARRAGGQSRAKWRQFLGFGVSLTAFSVAANLALPPRDAIAGEFPASAFQTYTGPSSVLNIQPGPLALLAVPVDVLQPTQINVGLQEIGKKEADWNIVPASQLQSVLLSDLEPVVIGPGGTLWQTNGHHTFDSLEQSIYGASDPTVYVNVIGNFSNMTMAQFLATMAADGLLYPVDNGVFKTVNPLTGSPLPVPLTGLTNDPYRGLEFSVLKQNGSKLFPSGSRYAFDAANTNGGAGIPGLDKGAAFFFDFIWADAYRSANGGLGLPYLTPTDVQVATAWSLAASSATTLPGATGAVPFTAAQLPGFILPTGGSITISGAISNSTLANGELDGSVTGTFAAATQDGSGTSGSASFKGLNALNVGGTVVVGPNTPGFVLQLGADNSGTVTLTGTNIYTGGTWLDAGMLIVNADAALGAAPPASVTIDPKNVVASVSAANGIIFNSLDEGAGSLEFAPSGTNNTITESRAIAVAGEVANIDVSGSTNTVVLTGQIASATADQEVGTTDITIDAAGGGTVLVAPASGSNPLFFGNWNIVGGTLEVASDAALGNTTGPSFEIGGIILNGGTFKPTASFASVRSFSVQSSSVIDVNGTATSFAGFSDIQRAMTFQNSGAGAGSVAFAEADFGGSVPITLAAGASTTGPGLTVNFTNGITRDNNSFFGAGTGTVFLNPKSGVTLGGTIGTNSVNVLSAGASATNTNGIAPVWIVTDSGSGSNPYDFLAYDLTKGYKIATYSSTNILTSTATDSVKQAGSAPLAANAQAFALNIQNGATLTATGHTLTIGDGTNPAGLILNGSAKITGGTLNFGSSEAIIYTQNSNAISSVLEGTNGLTLAGAGTLKLQGTTSGWAGTINIDSGTLELDTANYFTNGGTNATVVLQDTKSKPSAAKLTLGAGASQTFAALDSVGNNSTITVASGDTLTIGDSSNQNSSLASAITTSGGVGVVTIGGTGLVDFSLMAKTSLNLSTTGTIVIDAGANLRVDAKIFANNTNGADNAISIGTGGQLQFTEGGGQIFAGAISGAGMVHLLDGTLELTNTGTWTGGTTIEVGAILDMHNANLPGNVTNAGGIVDFDLDSTHSQTYAGVISDGQPAGILASQPGQLVKDDSANESGAGSNLTLTAVQAYTGATTIEAGTLTLGAGSSIASSSGVVLGRVGGPIDSQTATLALGANETIKTLSSNPSTTTSGVNTSVSVSLGANTLTLAPGAGTAAVYGGNISGTGGLVIAGHGLQVLDGSSMTIGGGVAVNSGFLEIGDAATNPTASSPVTTLASNVTVGAGGTLLGHGMITGTVTNTAGGVVAPGGSIGTLSVTGSYAQSGSSSLAIEISPTTASKLAVTGTASIGGVIAVLPDAGSYSRGTSYQVLTASGGVSGTFGSVAGLAQFVFQPVYKTNEVDLLLAGFAPAASLNSNELGAFNALENAPIGSATDNLLNTIGSQSGTTQAQFLNQLNSYSAASNLSVMTVGMSTFQDAIGGRASADPDMGAQVKTAQLVTDDWLPIPANRFTVWSQGIGQFGTINGTSSAPGQNNSVGGGVIGIDTALDPATRVGASFGATTGGVSVDGLSQSGTTNSYALGLYGGRWFGPLGIDAEVMGAYNTATSTRFISLSGMSAKGSTSGFGAGVSGAARYRVDTAYATLEPQLGLEYSHSHLDGYTETGAGLANLNVAAMAQDNLRSAAGAEVFRAFADPSGYTVVPEFRAAWLHQFLDTTPSVRESFAATPSAAFSTTGVNVGRDAALLEAGFAFKAPEINLTFYAQYAATLSSREVDHTVRGGFAFYW